MQHAIRYGVFVSRNMEAAVSNMHIEIEIEGQRSGNELKKGLLTCTPMVPSTNTP